MVEEPADESGMFYRDTLAQLCRFFVILFVLFIRPVLVIVNVHNILDGLMKAKEKGSGGGGGGGGGGRMGMKANVLLLWEA